MPIMTDAGFGPDDWTTIGADAPVSGQAVPDQSPSDQAAFNQAVSGKAILPLADLAARWDALARDAEAIGVAIPNDADLGDLAPYLGQIALIAAPFPSFADGRAFSLARRLRAMGFKGTLRATGKIVADQYAYARACGFDEVEVDPAIAERQPEAQWRAMAGSLALGYQRGYDHLAHGGRNILEARRAVSQSALIAAE